MPEDYKTKKNRGLVDLDFGANNTICVTEKTQNLKTNSTEIVGTEFFTSKQLDDQISDLQTQMDQQAAPIRARIGDLTLLRNDVAQKEQERTASESDDNAEAEVMR